MGGDTGTDDRPDCTTCGACCRFSGEVIVDPVDTVSRHLTRRSDTLSGSAPNAEDIVVMARAPDGRCIALEGEIGVSCRCAVYDDRPAVCRDFTAGSIACRGARSAVFI